MGVFFFVPLSLPPASNAPGVWFLCVLPYCPEAAAGQTVTTSGAKIVSVNHTKDEKGEPDETIVELSKTPGNVSELLIPAPVTAAARMGLSDADLEAIKGVVNAL